MLVTRVVHDEIEDDADAARVRLLDEAIEIVIAAEQGVDGRVVADVIADVESGRWVDRRKPDRVDPEPFAADVVEMVDDPLEIADPIPVRVSEASRVDLIDDAALPPVIAEAG